MHHIEILDNDFKRLAFIDNNLEEGIHFSNDKLSTSIEGGIYTLEMTIHKDSPQHEFVKEGNYITFINRQGVRILGTIMNVDETRLTKNIYMEDASINLINKVAHKMDEPEIPQKLEYYLTESLSETGWKLGKNESTKDVKLNFSSHSNLMTRLKEIAEAFEVEFYFETLFTTPGNPDFRIHFVKKRLEGEEGFRLSSDDCIEEITRKTNIDNIVTKLIVEGKEPEKQTGVSTRPKSTSTIMMYGQGTAKLYDHSKSSGATRLTTTGWNLDEVNRFRMDAQDPPYVTGEYIDNFLKNYYPDSPLIGYGRKIKDYADYFGVAVGAFLGVIAKESTFGRNSCGGRYNFGCIMWTSGSPFGKKYAGDRNWIDPQTIEQSLGAWFKLVRFNYIDSGQVTYKDFLNKYSPSFENNQATFKNIMWATIKSFGYNVNDTGKKKRYARSSDNPATLKVENKKIAVVDMDVVPGTSATTANPTGNGKTVHDTMIDKLIKWFTDREGKVRYSMNARSGPSSYDCSSAVYSALFYAGFKPNINYLGSTVSLWSDIGSSKLMVEISRSQARRGDIFLSGGRGAASAGANGHTGVFLSNSQIIHCNYRDNGITRTQVEGRAGSPIYCFRLVNRHAQLVNSNGQSSSSNQPSNKVETAVQRCLSRVGKTPYVWGGTSINGWDCSGMVYEAYRYAGFTINHRCTTRTIAAQQSPFIRISAAEARRGDLVIQHSGGHVAVLLGAPSSGAGIVHAATPALGTITQKSITSVNGYYRVRGG